MDGMLWLLLALLGVPLAGAVAAGVGRARAAPTVAAMAALITAVLGVSAVLFAYPQGAAFRAGGLPWLPGGSGEGLFGLAIDPLSSIMVLVITVIGFLVVLYSTEYLSPRHAEHPVKEGAQRYYFWLLLFVMAMVGVAL